MKIAILTDFVLGQYFGGGERRYFEVLNRLADQGHIIDIYCMKSNEKLQYDNKNITIHQIGPKVKNPPHRSMFQIIYFLKLSFFKLLFKKYDVIEAQGPAILTLFWLKLFGKKNTVALIHDLSSGEKDQWFMSNSIAEKVEKFVYKLPTKKTITVSNNVKHRLEKEYKRKNVHTVYNGIDNHLIESVSAKKENKIVFVGRLIPHKHVDDLLKAIKDINTNLRIVGSGPELKNLKSLTKKLNIESKVKFLGTLKDYKEVIKEIKSSKALILPSTREGFGLVLAEAMYCGTVPIAYESDGASEVINNKVNGLLIEQRNIAQLKKAIKETINKDNSKILKSAKNKVQENFIWEKTINKLISVYKK